MTSVTKHQQRRSQAIRTPAKREYKKVTSTRNDDHDNDGDHDDDDDDDDDVINEDDSAIMDDEDTQEEEESLYTNNDDGADNADGRDTSTIGVSFKFPSVSFSDAEVWARQLYLTATSHERFALFCYNNSLILSLINQLIIIILIIIMNNNILTNTNTLNNIPIIIILIIGNLSQLLIIIYGHIGLISEITQVYVRPIKIWNMYISIIINFTSIYFLYFLFDRTSLIIEGYNPSDNLDINILNDNITDLQTYDDIPTIYIFILYFSGAIMTSTGFGDIAPVKWYSQITTNAQMLIGTTYHIGVFGLTLAHFRTFTKLTIKDKLFYKNNKNKNNEKSSLEHTIQFINSLKVAERLHNISPIFTIIRKLIIKYLLIISIILQICITCLLFIIPNPFIVLTSADGNKYINKIIIISIMVLLQLLLFIAVLFVSFRLVRNFTMEETTNNNNEEENNNNNNHNNQKKKKKNELNFLFLIQSYLATVLLFGGIYFILYVATPHHQFSRADEFNLSNIFEVLYIFIHFSLTIMTTTGFGDIYARGIIARLFVLIEMMVSILYNAVIIGLGTSQLIDLQAGRAEQEFMKLKKQQEEESLIKQQQEDEAENVNELLSKNVNEVNTMENNTHNNTKTKRYSRIRGSTKSGDKSDPTNRFFFEEKTVEMMSMSGLIAGAQTTPTSSSSFAVDEKNNPAYDYDDDDDDDDDGVGYEADANMSDTGQDEHEAGLEAKR